jgi:two-component system, chemotaxis family, protein-glutamate methylesterase/glutaminase
MAAVQVLICEDSRVYAVALRRMLEYDGDVKAVSVCGTAEEAIAALPRLRPDLMTMDVELSGMNGLDAVGEIMSSQPLPILMLSSYVGFGSDKAVAALAAGALDAIPKDELDLDDPAGRAAAAFRHRVKVLSRARVIRHPRAKLATGSAAGSMARRASVVGVCASTGGPQMLMFMLAGLPADYPIPVLVVQHMAAGFTEGLVRWLDRSVALPVAVAAAGIRPGPGAWIAPHGAHLMLTGAGRLVLDRDTVAGHHRPSADVLLDSIAATAGRTGVAVVLSGTDRDGAAGAAAVRRRGGLAIAQDERSSAVFGTPRAAIELGIDAVLSPSEIVGSLRRLRSQPLAGARLDLDPG